MRIKRTVAAHQSPSRTSKEPMTIAVLRPLVFGVTRAYGVRNVRIFGSFARGEQRSTSDLDLLVSMPEHSSLFDLAGLKADLEEALQRNVDVVPDDSIKPMLRNRILSEALAL